MEKLVKNIYLVTSLVTLILVSIPAMAVPPGQQVEFTKSSMGKVTFLGDIHKKYKCEVCHATLFKMAKGSSKITFTEHQGAKRYCFFCHNSGGAFSALENCTRCHIKETPPPTKSK